MSEQSMKKLIILTTIISFLLVGCKTNYTRIGDKNANYIPYYLKVYEADSLFLIENYQRSYEILDSLFKKYEAVNLPEYNEYGTYLACSYMIKEKSTGRNVKKGYAKFNNLGIWHKKYKVIYKGLDSLLSKKEVLSAKNIYYKNIDFKLRDKIISMIQKDQEIRKNKDFEMMELFSRRHEISLDSIFLASGFPTKDRLGVGLNGESVNLNILLLHLNPNKRQDLVVFLRQNLVNGKYSPDEYATIIDRDFIEKNNEMYYGQYQNEGLNFAKDTLTVDQRRRIIGLPTLDYDKYRSKYISEIMNGKY